MSTWNMGRVQTDAQPAAGERADPAARQARRSVLVLFLLMGLTTGSWAARIPGIRAQLRISDQQWGLANIGATAGSLLALTTVVALIARIGPRPLVLVGGPLLLLVAPFTAASRTIPALICTLFVQGLATGLLAGPMNAQAVEVERRYGRRIMSSFHACFSGGQLVGGVLGTAAAHLGIAPTRQLAASGLLLLVLLAVSFRQLPTPGGPARRAPAATNPSARRGRLTPQLLLLAGIALLASINEGSAAQWSAQYTSAALGAGAAAGAATYTCYTIAMAASRATGDRIVNRLGHRTFIRFSELLVVVGFGSALLIGTPAAAFVGFALLGVGSGCIVPSVIGLAGNQPGVAAGSGVAVVSFGQWPAILIGPPLIGAVAGLVGLRGALFVLVAAGALIIGLAWWIRPGDRSEQLISARPSSARG